MSHLKWTPLLSAPLAICILVLLALVRADAVGTTVTIGSTNGSRGATVSFPVTFQLPSTSVAVQNDIGFNAVSTPIVADPTTGKPSCVASPTMVTLNKSVSFVFLPNGCTGTSCTKVRTLITDNNGSLIPNGATLYTCNVKISATAPIGIYPLVGSNIAASTTAGLSVVVSGINGQITVTL